MRTRALVRSDPQTWNENAASCPGISGPPKKIRIVINKRSRAAEARYNLSLIAAYYTLPVYIPASGSRAKFRLPARSAGIIKPGAAIIPRSSVAGPFVRRPPPLTLPSPAQQRFLFHHFSSPRRENSGKTRANATSVTRVTAPIMRPAAGATAHCPTARKTICRRSLTPRIRRGGKNPETDPGERAGGGEGGGTR